MLQGHQSQVADVCFDERDATVGLQRLLGPLGQDVGSHDELLRRHAHDGRRVYSASAISRSPRSWLLARRRGILR